MIPQPTFTGGSKVRIYQAHQPARNVVLEEFRSFGKKSSNLPACHFQTGVKNNLHSSQKTKSTTYLFCKLLITSFKNFLTAFEKHFSRRD